MIFGITFIDHINRVVFNGSDLGKAYSAKAITEKFAKGNKLSRDQEPALRPAMRVNYLKAPEPTSFLEMALAKTQTEQGTGIPRKRKKRRKRSQQLNEQLTL